MIIKIAFAKVITVGGLVISEYVASAAFKAVTVHESFPVSVKIASLEIEHPGVEVE